MLPLLPCKKLIPTSPRPLLQLLRCQVARLCQFMGEHHTNNQAEYAGLIGGLQAALDMGCRSIKVQGDSTLIIRQARQRCRCGGGGGGGGGRLHLAWQLRCS